MEGQNKDGIWKNVEKLVANELIWFSLCFHFARHDRKGWQELTRQSFETKTDDNGAYNWHFAPSLRSGINDTTQATNKLYALQKSCDCPNNIESEAFHTRYQMPRVKKKEDKR